MARHADCDSEWSRVYPSRIRLPATQLRIGLTPEEASNLYELCARETLPDDCQELVARETGLPRNASVSEFWIDRTEVTELAFAECARIGACPTIAHPTDDARSRQLPVTQADRDAARSYCRFQGGRLPTQLEFERAARGAQSRLFPWGSLYNSMAANHGRFGADPTDASDGYPTLSPVGSYSSGATPEGIHDLAGNVAEWVEPVVAADASVGPTSPLSFGLVCGGSHRTGSVTLTGAACRRVDPKTLSSDIGFRCVYDHLSSRLSRFAFFPLATEPPRNFLAPKHA